MANINVIRNGIKWESINEFRQRFIGSNGKPLSIQALDYAMRPSVDKIDYMKLGNRIRIIILTPKTLAYTPNVTKNRTFPRKPRKVAEPNNPELPTNEDIMHANKTYYRKNEMYRDELAANKIRIEKEKEKERKKARAAHAREMRARQRQRAKERKAKEAKALKLLKFKTPPNDGQLSVEELLKKHRRENNIE